MRDSALAVKRKGKDGTRLICEAKLGKNADSPYCVTGKKGLYRLMWGYADQLQSTRFFGGRYAKPQVISCHLIFGRIVDCARAQKD